MSAVIDEVIEKVSGMTVLELAGGQEASALKLVRPIQRRHYGLVAGPS